jgi:hypothetical protein
MKNPKSTYREKEQFVVRQETALIIAITIALTLSILFISIWLLGIAILLLIPLMVYDIYLTNLKYAEMLKEKAYYDVRNSISNYRKVSQYLFFVGAVFFVTGVVVFQSFLIVFTFLFFLLGFMELVKVMNLGQMQMVNSYIGGKNGNRKRS